MIQFMSWVICFSLLFTTLGAPFVEANLWGERRKAAEDLNNNSGQPTQVASAIRHTSHLAPQNLGGDIANEITNSLSNSSTNLSPSSINEILKKIRMLESQSMQMD